MKSYYHSKVLSQRLSAFCTQSKPMYLVIDIAGFRDKLMLKAAPGAEFIVKANMNKFILWEQSEYAKYDPEEILGKFKDKITKMTFLGKTFNSWNEFTQSYLEDSDVVEPVYRSTIWFTKSIEIAMKLRAKKEKKNIRQVVIDAMNAYL